MGRHGNTHLGVTPRVSRRAIGLPIAALGLLLLISGDARAQGKPIRVQKVLQPLDYALVASTTTAGTITIDSATGTKTASGGAISLGGLHTRAYFQISGEKNTSFSITLPASITITAPGGATTTITGFESTPAFTGTLDSSGKAYVYVGAVLQVGAGQTSGLYSSIFDITVDYLP